MNSLVASVAVRLIAEQHLTDTEARSWASASKTMHHNLRDYRIRRLMPLDMALGMSGGAAADLEPCPWEHVFPEKQSFLFGRFSTVIVDDTHASLLPHLHELPSHVTALIFSDDFNQEIEDLKFPSGIIHMYFGHGFNQKIEGLKLPESLQALEFASTSMFNQPFSALVLPETLRSLVFGRSFNHSLGRLPSSLTELRFDEDSIFNQSCGDLILPPFLEMLIFGFRCEAPKARDESGTQPAPFLLPKELPPTIRRLVLPTTFDQPQLGGVKLPESLVALTFGVCYNSPLDEVVFPSSMESLIFPHHSRFNHPLHRVTLPAELKRLVFGRWFNQDIHGVELPPGLKYLRFGSAFDRSIRHVALPSTLEHLEFVQYPHPLHVVKLPASLTSLIIHHRFNHPLDQVALPPTLHELHLGCSFNKPLSKWTPPEGLKLFDLGCAWNQAPEALVLPQKLLKFSMPNSFLPTISLKELKLPASVESMRLSNLCRLARPLQELELPSSLVKLDLGGKFDQSLAGITFPATLSSLIIGSSFTHSLNELQAPEGLLCLRIECLAPLPTQGWRVPASVTHLAFGVGWNHTIDDIKFPPNLEIIELCSFNHPVTGVCLPQSLRELRFAFPRVCSPFNQPMNELLLPESLRVLEIGEDFNQPLETCPELPSSLRRLEIRPNTDAKLARWRQVTLPIGCCLVKCAYWCK